MLRQRWKEQLLITGSYSRIKSNTLRLQNPCQTERLTLKLLLSPLILALVGWPLAQAMLGDGAARATTVRAEG